jgi:alkylation response protein AidB-like acyl-CoA dehydrogenase
LANSREKAAGAAAYQAGMERMTLGYDEVQRALDESVRRALESRVPLQEMRRRFEAGEGFSAATWAVLEELGLIGADIPESDGGVGLGTLESCIVADALGRVLAAVPYSSNAAALRLLSVHGTADQKRNFLEPALYGRALGCLAVSEPGNDLFGPAGCAFSAGMLTGPKSPVAGGIFANFAVVACRNDSGANQLVLVSLDSASLKRSAVSSLEPTRGHARLLFENAPAEALGGKAAFEEAVDLAATLLAHEQVGWAEKCLEMAIAHASERMAFGRPIGSFHAIKHRLVDAYAKNRLARTHALHAAWAYDHDPVNRGLAAAAAHVAAMRAFSFAAAEMMQIHGALGVTWDHAGHLFYRRARLLAAELGDLPMWQERIFSLLDDREKSRDDRKECR